MAGCCNHTLDQQSIGKYRRVLWIVIAINATMFVVEMTGGLLARSVSLQADALDFLGDAATYGISLVVLSMSLRWRAGAALVKGASMGMFGVWVIGNSIYHMLVPGVPSAPIMGSIGFAALVANVICAFLLYRHRQGDANMRSVWLCSRNDAVSNIAVMMAASGVWATNTGWPDLVVGAIMASLALSACYQVLRQARGEWVTAAA
ncbi:MAG: cation diffusion facilitator family transporter [Rhodospirillales bacterium]|nr:cation diffusion facilitator family transporter [Rhodospirillales bacterium]